MAQTDRMWMYNRQLHDGHLNKAFVYGVNEFMKYAVTKHEFMNGEEIRCPCTGCRNKSFRHPNEVKTHLYKFGFVDNYLKWNHHGEPLVSSSLRGIKVHDHMTRPEPNNSLQHLADVATELHFQTQIIEEPNPESKEFFGMLRSLDAELWPGCENHSILSMIARLLKFKSEHHVSDKGFDSLLQLVHKVLPPDNKFAENFCETKKLIKELGLPVQEIDCCPQGCMLYWKDDSELNNCKLCQHARFKNTSSRAKQKNIPYRRMYYFPLAPRLRRLYASKASAVDMRWHHEHSCDDGSMCHPCDSEAWKHFNSTNESFAAEPRNVRLGLYMKGFQPLGQSGQQYSSWPIMVTPYNLPPEMCMKEQYMFLTVLVPGPNNPGYKIDVFLQPLIAELKDLWENGVIAYDISLKQNFNLRAALMWTISDFSGYSMLSGWSTNWYSQCPHCMFHAINSFTPIARDVSWFDGHRRFLPSNHAYRNNTNNFTRDVQVTHYPPPIVSGAQILAQIEGMGLLKVTDPTADYVNARINPFDCGWKKKSIFWDLPYWKTNLIRHNLDVMDIEKNVFENVINTVMNIEGKTKDNAKYRDDCILICKRRELEKDTQSGKYPKAWYTLNEQQKRVLCEWVKQLKFPDDYVSNLARYFDEKKYKIFGMKNHDCHVFMQRLLPIALVGLLPHHIWEPITELSIFFRNLSAKVLKMDDMKRLDKEIPQILCNLEMIFPPGFFDCMVHLSVHLPYEARIAGPVQYRWMHPFEKYIGHLKKNVKNNTQVEDSICNAYIVEEASNFCSFYFEPHVYTRVQEVSHNDDGGRRDSVDKSDLMMFSHEGRTYGHSKTRWLNDKEYNEIHTFVLLNCPEVDPFVELYRDYIRGKIPNASDSTIETQVDENFAAWFLDYAENNVIQNKCIANLVHGPGRGVLSFPVYIVNGYKFHTVNHDRLQSSSNSSVCVTTDEYDYYGTIDEIIQVSYSGTPHQKTVLFKCHWYNPTPKVGRSVLPLYNIVLVNMKSKCQKISPFVLAFQATKYITPRTQA